MNARRGVPLPLVLVVALSLAAVSAPSAGASARRAGGDAAPLGPARADATVSLTLVLRFPGSDALAAYLAAQRLQAAPAPLTPAQIGERFGIPSARLDAVTARLEQAGIRVTQRYDQRTALLAAGSVRDVERLFQVRLEDYRDRDGIRYRAPSRSPRIPSDLTDAVSDVEGLNTRPVFAPASAPGQTGGGSSATFVTPQQLNQIYDANPLAQAGIDGSGETIAVASLATLHGEEFSDWAAHFKTSTQPSRTISIAPPALRFGQRGWSASDSDEVALDLEMTRALAPKATILDYTTENDGEGLERVINQVVQDRRATIVSISYGNCEPERGAAAINGYENAFMAAQAAGVDVFAASGDSGPYDCNDSSHTNDLRQAVNYPASSAYVTSVGGTTLSNQGGDLHETAWQEPAVPDVAGPASPDFNLLIADFQSGHVVLQTGGGTSAAAPFWAGLTALIKQYVRGREPSFPDGSVSAMLYQIANTPALYPAAFHDVTTGGNQVFTASSGWDFLTGLGTPNISGLAKAFDTLVHAARS